MARGIINRILNENRIPGWKYLIAIPGEMRLCETEYFKVDDSPRTSELKKKFLPLIALYRLLKRNTSDQKAYDITFQCLREITKQTWSRWNFEGRLDSDRYFEINRCIFNKVFYDFGLPGMAEALYISDEINFGVQRGRTETNTNRKKALA